MFTVDMARQGCKELLAEGYGFDAVRIYLNDLSRSDDITWEDCLRLKIEMLESGADCSMGTF